MNQPTARLSTLDRFLPLWIGIAMALGLALGRLVPGLDDRLDDVKVGSVSMSLDRVRRFNPLPSALAK